MNWFLDNPGRLYVVATLLPLAAFALLLLGGLIRTLARPYRDTDGTARFFYWLFGGDKPLKAGAYTAVGAIGLAAGLSLVGLVRFLQESEQYRDQPAVMEARWAERGEWARVGTLAPKEDPRPALALEIGYRIDHLTAVMFAMVCCVSTCIFVFSLGYVRDETDETVEDHEVVVPPHSDLTEGHAESEVPEPTHPVRVPTPPPEPHGPAHLHRRGRFGRFFLFLSLFCFSMLNLLIADNFFQVFISWELVGVCSFFLIGFYYERNSASVAANKAFIVNRVGDAGFLIGLALVWAYFGTFNFQEAFAKLRTPPVDSDMRGVAPDLAGTVLRGDRFPNEPDSIQLSPNGANVLLFPAHWHAQDLRAGQVQSREHPTDDGEHDFTAFPYYLWVIAGLGIFLGCVGKSAQFPLHTWLPDAMEGPTPVSALIHAATMVAAGVYLVGRCYPFFAPEVLLTIAYTGAITLFLAATIALVMADIKRVLAYSTVSQLGYMMLALGVGGWVAGLLHLLTHAFFKALLFLCAGSVIFGCHHEQDLRKMGGLGRKMRITSITMLIGVLAIAGTPLFSGWYSKDRILGSTLGYGMVHGNHMILFVLPLLTAGLTAFYMFRLWFLAFAGKPRDEHVYEHARESPAVMTVPLVILAACSVGIAWGWPLWDPEASYLGHLLHEGQPAAVTAQFAAEHVQAEEHHGLAGILALLAAAVGFAVAAGFYYLRKWDAERVRAALPGIYQFLTHKWYFDELYRALFVRPVVRLAFAVGAFDKRPPSPGEPEIADTRVDPRTVDGFLSALGLLLYALGLRLRALQSGLIRRYVLVLVLTAVVMFAILSYLAGRSVAG